MMLHLADIPRQARDAFFARLYRYFKEDLSGLPADFLEYLLSEEYRTTVEALMDRAQNPIRAVHLSDDAGQLLAFAMYCNYATEDGKLFIMEFCVEKALRGQGYGRQLYSLIEAREKARGAKFAELTPDAAVSFWESLGFVNTGRVDPDNGDCIFRKEI